MTDDQSLIDVLTDASHAMRVEELEGAVERLRRVVGGSGALLARFGDRGDVPSVVAGNLVAAMDDYSADVYEVDPVHPAKRRLAPQASMVRTSQLIDHQRFRASAAYADFYRVHELDHHLCVSLNPLRWGEPGMLCMLIGRSRRSGEFGEEAARVVAVARPAFVAATRRCAAFGAIEQIDWMTEELLDHADGQSNRGYLVFDLHGRLRWMSQRAERLLGPELTGGGELPASLAAAVERLGHLALGDGAEPMAPTTSVNVVLGPSCCRQAELFLSRTAAGEPVVVAALVPGGRDPAAALALRYGLTATESEVLALLAEGLSNRAIAERRYVSIETVRTHVKSVLRKLEVESRLHAALLVRDQSIVPIHGTG